MFPGVTDAGTYAQRRTFTRRHFFKGLATLAGPAAPAAMACLDDASAAPGFGRQTWESVAASLTPLPPGIRSRFVENINGLTVHVLEAGFDAMDRPCVLLLHGFPELAYSWRKVMLPLAKAGFHVIAPDQRGYGRTTGWDANYEGDLRPFRMLNLVRDVLGLVWALGYRSVAAVVGHDFGSPVAAWCSIVRPDVFRSAVLMSAPFGGTPRLPFNTATKARSEVAAVAASRTSIHDELAALERPRKHYQRYYTTREANGTAQPLRVRASGDVRRAAALLPLRPVDRAVEGLCHDTPVRLAGTRSRPPTPFVAGSRVPASHLGLRTMSSTDGPRACAPYM